MKALSMLDHVMLWVARVFAVAMVAEILFPAQDLYASYRQDYIDQIRYHQTLSWERALIKNEQIETFLLVLILPAIMWNASLWWLKKDSGRLYLFLSGALMFAISCYVLANRQIMNPHLPNLEEGLNAVALLVGFFAFAWIGFRGPGSPWMRWTPLTMRSRKNSQQSQPSTPTSLFSETIPTV